MITSFGLVPKVVKRAAGKTAKVAKVVAKPAAAVGALALKPLRSRINTLTTRRANKLAWDRRRSKTPTPGERAEARAWTKKTLTAKGPHGRLLALLAGASPTEAHYTLGGFGITPGALGVEPATIALISASLPVLTKLLQSILTATAKSGEAPVSPETAAVVPEAPTVDEPVAAEEIEEAAMSGALGHFSDGFFGDELGVTDPRTGTAITIGLSAAAAGLGLFLALR